MVTRNSTWHNAIGSRNTYGTATPTSKRYTALKDFIIDGSTINVKKGDILLLSKMNANTSYYAILISNGVNHITHYVPVGFVKEIVPAMSYIARTTQIA